MSQLLIGIILFGVMGVFIGIAFVSCYCSSQNAERYANEENEHEYYSFNSRCNNIIARV